MKLGRSQLINLVVLLASLGSVLAVWLTRSAPTTGELAARSPRLLVAWRPEQVSRLELGGSGQQIVLERQPALDGGLADFQLSKPVHETADAAAVEKLLSALGNANVLRRVEDGADKKSLGLDPPSRVIDIQMGPIAYHLRLGGAAPAPAGARYLDAVAEGASSPGLVLIDKAAAEDLVALDLNALRSRSLVSLSESDVTRIELHSPTLDVLLVRDQGSRFFLDGQPKRRADRNLIDSLFFQLSRLTAEPFLTLAEAEPALGNNRARIVLTSGDKQPLTLELGGPCPKNQSELTVVRRAPDPRAACVSREIGASLALTRDGLIDRHPFTLHADEVEELELSSGEHKLSLARKGTAFLLRGKNDSEVELAIGNRRISELVEIQGELGETDSLAKLGLEPPRGRATVRSSAATASNVVEESVRVGARDERGRVPLYREADGALLWLTAAQARSFQPDETLLRKRKLLEFGPTSLLSLEIAGRDQIERLSRDGSGNLQLELPKGFTLDGALATDLLQQLGSLETERFVADANDGSFGLETPLFTVHFSVRGEEAGVTNHTLRVGAKTAGGAFASLDADAAVFIVSHELLDALDTSLIDRSVLAAAPESLASISVSDGEHKLVLTRHGDTFGSASATLGPERIADFIELVGALRAEAAVHTGGPRPAEGFDKPTLTLTFTPSHAGEHPKTLRLGAGDSWRNTSVFYARVEGVDATFVVAQSKVRALHDLL
ncbi:MAG TPA: DUF4340 domain-containing protein [Polyangiaceae bacterium]